MTFGGMPKHAVYRHVQLRLSKEPGGYEAADVA